MANHSVTSVILSLGNSVSVNTSSSVYEIMMFGSFDPLVGWIVSATLMNDTMVKWLEQLGNGAESHGFEFWLGQLVTEIKW